MFAVRLFGPPAIEGEAGPLHGRAAQRHRLGLLALLCTAPGHQLSRDKLLAYLWPESDGKRARHLLNVSVHVLRKELGEESILSAGDDLRLNTEIVGSDVVEFEEAIAEDEAERAVELYAASFLDGFHLNGSVEFERWLDRERDRLATLYEGSLRSLAAEAERQASTEAAVKWWRRLAAHNPYSGDIAVGLMRALEAAGDHGGAIRHATNHETLLREELGAEPDPAVVAVSERLKAEPAGSRIATEADSSLGAETPDQAAAGDSGVLKSHWKRRRQRLLWAIGSAAVALVLIGVIVGPGLLSPGPEASEPAAPAVFALEPNRVLVLPFANQTGDPELDRLGAMAADWITRGLAETGIVRAVPAMGIEPVEAQEALGGLAGAARALAEATRAAIVISGSFYQQGDSLAFETQITDVASGELLRAIGGITASSDEPIKAVEELRQRTTGALATVLDPRLSSWASAARQPPSYEAYLHYADGMDLYLRRRYDGAGAHFARAAARDPTFTAPLLWTISAYRHGGKLAQADSLARELEPFRVHLAPWDRAMLDYHLASLRGDQAGAYRALQRTVEHAPASEWLYLLARAAFYINQPQQTVDVLGRLSPELGWIGEWHEYWEYLAKALHQLGDYQQELEAVRKGRLQHPENDHLKVQQLRALVALGKGQDAIEVWEEILDPNWRAHAAILLIRELRVHGQASTAIEVAESAIVWHATRPDEEESPPGQLGGGAAPRGMESGDFFHARLLYAAERWDESRRIFERLAAERSDFAFYQGYLGALAARRGNRDEQMRISRWLAALDEPYLLGSNTLWRASIAALLGERERAVELLRTAFDEGLTYGLWLHTDPDLQHLWDYPPFQELVRPKG